MMKLKLQKSLRSTEDASSVGNGNHSDESDIPCSRIDDEEYPSDAFSALANHQQAALGFPRAETAAPALPSSRCGLGSQRSLRHPIASLHAQALILGVAFCALWTPSNIMAPNLTKMAEDFGLREQERDIYLGSYCALAVGVFSFPISAIIGLSVDLGHCSRKSLLVLTCIMSASAALLTALSQAYWQLFLCRFAQGGFMGASVPIVFSFLSDMFAPSERNVASSGLTAMMGVGILLGQLYAGFNGWRQAFFLSSGLQLMVALLCLWSIRDPPRGAKELALQELFRSGSHYDRKLTFRSFHASVVKNKSNSILLWQGFFSSIPWGVIFCFLNDYLSQERGFPVPDATLLVFLFGVGCTLGGVLGGWAGGWLGTLPQGSGLPLFMALSTSAAILPFFFLLNSSIVDPRGFKCIGLALSCGMVASLPAVNVRPCLISVNPPETRGSSLTAANLLIQLGRGIGPSFVTGVICRFQTSRQFAFNLSVSQSSRHPPLHATPRC
jgi:translation initiation factor 4G